MRWLIVFILVCSCAAQIYAPFQNPHQQYLDQNGKPLAGGTLTTYAAGTLNPLSTYKDANGTPNTNPVVLDSSGYATIYMNCSLLYKVIAADSTGQQLWTVDEVTCGASGGGGGGSGIISINGDNTPAQVFTGGTGISITDSGGGQHTIAATGGGGTIGSSGSLAQGQPAYGKSATTIQTAATELAADTFSGADICAKVTAAMAALPTTGGVIVLSANNYPVCAASITINKKNITLRGAGMGNWGLGTAATVLNFPAGMSGIVSTSEITVIKDMYVKSASTAAGSDNGISFAGGSPRVERVIVQGFGGRGVVFNNNTDLWRLDSAYADSNKGDGFYWAPACSDQNAGFAVGTSATNNGGYGYNIQCGGANYFQTTHAANNTGGAWMVNTTYNYFTNVYVEGGAGSSFTFTSTAAYNTAYFNAFGQPSPLTDLGIAGTNTIYYEGSGGSDGGYPAQTTFSLTGAPQHSPGAFYSFITDTGGYFPGDLIIRDRKNGLNMAYYANGHGWNFLTPVTIGIDNSVAGILNIANGSVLAHTTIKTQATNNTLFNLPVNNGTVGQSLTTDGAGNTSWATISGGTGAVSSVTGSGTVSCSPTTGAVVCNGTGGGITNSAGSNIVMKSDGTNAMASSLSDNGTTVATTLPLNAATLSTGAGASGCPASGCFSLAEAPTAGTPTAGYDYCRADSASHAFLCSFNGGAEAPLSGGGGGGSPPFSSVTAGTNTSALVMGSGGSLTVSGSGTIAATSVPAAGLGAGTISNNTSGTASNLSGTPALPNGTTATTQTTGDNSTKIATTAFVQANAGSSSGACNPLDRTQLCIVEEFFGGLLTTGNIGTHGWAILTVGSAGGVTGVASVWPHMGILSLNTNATATQGQGESIYLGTVSTILGNLAANTNWTFFANFQLQDITTTVFRIGLISTANSPRPASAIALRYDVNSPLVNQAITSIVCTVSQCTVTDSGGTLNMPGQDMTISGATCAYRTVNGTQHMITYTNATTWSFASTGTSGETCSVPGTVSTVAETNFKVYTQNTSAAAATVVDTGVAADTNWHDIQIQSTTAGTIVFTLDGGTPISISTTVPTSGIAMTADLCTDVTLTAAKSVYLDRIVFYMTGLTR